MATASTLMIYPIIYHRRQEGLHKKLNHEIIDEITLHQNSTNCQEKKNPFSNEAKVLLDDSTDRTKISPDV